MRPADLEDLCIAEKKTWPEIVFQGTVARGQIVCVASADRPWAPYAVGRMHRSSVEFLSTGFHGIAVEIMHTEGDALWAMGSKTPAPSAPPAALLAAMEEARAAEAARGVAQAARAVEAARAAVEARIADIPRLRRKAEKSLRQIADLKGKGAAVDAAQADKLSKEGSLVAEVDALDRELTKLLSEGGEGVVDPSGATKGYIAESGSDNNGGVASGASESVGGESGEIKVSEDADAEGAAETDEADDSDLLSETDALFLSSLLAELSLACPSPNAPLLLSTLFGRASLRAGGVGVKKTTWKTSAAILESLPEGAVATRFTGGKAAALEVVAFDRSLAPAFSTVAPDAPAAGVSAATATKKGPEVIISERMVKNHHVTFVDGLEAWGFEKDRLELLACELRRLFGVSAAVGVRSGTEDNLSKGRKQLWSLKLGGQLSDEVKGALAARGVDKAKLPPKKKGKRR